MAWGLPEAGMLKFRIDQRTIGVLKIPIRHILKNNELSAKVN